MHLLIPSIFIFVGSGPKVLTGILAFVFVLGVLVFVHEFGHYAVAKLCGVRVEVFSLGFGKRLWGFRRGDTDYRLSILPLGGYVKMSGENPMEDRTGDPGEFMSHPRWQRFLIAIAGPVMNIILAVVVLTGVYMVHDEEPAFLEQPADIGWVLPNSPADKAGIHAGDRITRIADRQNPTWNQVIPKIALSANESVDLLVQRGDQSIPVKITPQPGGPDRVGQTGWLPQEPAMVGAVESNRAAVKAGLQAGDQIETFNGVPLRNMEQMIDQLQQVKTEPIHLTVLRDKQQLGFTLAAELLDDGTGRGTKSYRIGISRANVMRVQKLPFHEAWPKSLATCKENSLLIYVLVGKMFERKMSIRSMSGPIGIAVISGDALREGMAELMKVMALISINLAIFNLFPIPILDGGLMLMLLIESVMRRDINQQVKERVYQAAFVFLILFAAMVIYNDLAKQFHG